MKEPWELYPAGRFLEDDQRYTKSEIVVVAKDHGIKKVVLFYETGDPDGFYLAENVFFLDEGDPAEHAWWLCERLEHGGHTTTIDL